MTARRAAVLKRELDMAAFLARAFRNAKHGDAVV
jgi:hypothetical protein